MAARNKRNNSSKGARRERAAGVSRPRNNAPWIAAIAVVLVAALLFFLRSDESSPIVARDPGPGGATTNASSGNAEADRDFWKPEDQSKAFAQYAGSESCRECHQKAFDDWMGSDHQLAERLPDAKRDGAAFQPPREYRHASQTTQLLTTNNRFQVVTKGLSGGKELFPIERVIGETPLRQYLIPFPRGRLQTLDATYDPHKNEWFNVYGDEDRQPGEWGHWTGRGMSWNTQCASCHNTRLRKNYDHKTDTYTTAMAEMSVGCEACHGPMKAHVDWRKQHADSKEPDPTERKFDRDQWVDTCGMCHSRRTELTGDFTPGDRYLDHFSHVIPNETGIYYADGQVREENYVFTSFLSSKMHYSGVRCMDCHQPHSMKLKLPGNVLCMQCHAAPRPEFPNSPVINPATHSNHSLTGEGGQCVNCHMPQTTYMQRDPRRDHGFTIPDPLLTKQHGIPNACNRCHQDKDADWAIAATEKWWGPRMNRPTRTRAQWIAGARTGAPGSRDNLLKMLKTEEMPFWQAVAAELIDPWVFDPEVSNALLEKVAHTNALVRGTVAHALDPLARRHDPRVEAAVGGLLKDPIRKVRVDAAWVLRDHLDLASEAGQDLLRSLDFNLDMPTGALQKGIFHLDRGEPDKALEHIEWAIQLDAYSAQLRHEYAVVLSMAGRSQDAIGALQEAIRLAPKEAEFHYKLGLAWYEVGRPDQTVLALEEAVRLNPRHARAWYNLGLMRNQMKRPEEAILALENAERAEPSDPQIPFALATVLLSVERRDEAAEAARRALRIQPNYREAQMFLRQLGN